jgi:hypothetical protein
MTIGNAHPPQPSFPALLNTKAAAAPAPIRAPMAAAAFVCRPEWVAIRTTSLR